MYTHIHIPGAWYMDTTAQEKYVIPAVLRKAQEGSSFAELAAGFGLTAAPPAAAEGMRGYCIQLPQPCHTREDSCKPLENYPPRPWVHPGACKSPVIQASAPAETASPADRPQFPLHHAVILLQQRISVYLLLFNIFFLPLQLQQGC